MRWTTWAVMLFLGVTTTAGAQAIDFSARSTVECSSVVIVHLDRTYKKAKRIEWNPDTLTSERGASGLLLSGEGTYKGKSGKRRRFNFDCTYDEYQGKVVKASWVSSFEPSRTYLVVDQTDDVLVRPGDVRDACENALDELITDKWPRYDELELVADNLKRSLSDTHYVLSGPGRFLGGAGSWHLFNFKCTYDARNREVSHLGWKHHGKEDDTNGDGHL